MTSSMQLEEVRSTLASLQSVELPAHGENGSVDASLLERYRQARDDYLKRRVLHSLFEHVETFSVDEQEQPRFVLPLVEEEEAIHDKKEQVVAKIQAAIQSIQDQKTELQVQFAAFSTKRDQLEQMVHEVATADDDDNNMMIEDDDMLLQGNDETVVVDEGAMQEQEEKLIVLQQRRAALEAEFRSVEKENMQVKKSIKQAKDDLEDNSSNILGDSTTIPLQALANLHEQNSKMESDLRQLEEIHAFYQHLVQILEELGGIRIVGIKQVPEQEQGNAKEELTLTVSLYGKHKIQVGLNVDDTRKRATIGPGGDNLKVVSATFLTSTLLESNKHQKDNNSESTPVVQLRIPDLKDLVGLADKLAPGENLRFVLREVSARIRTLQARVEELTELHSVALTKIYPIKSTVSFGGDDQEVICSLEQEQMSVLLRMTPDCPLVKGSVYVAQLVGVGGWDNAVVADIEATVNAREEYRRPVDVIRAVQEEICRRQEHEGLQLPMTPTLPARRG